MCLCYNKPMCNTKSVRSTPITSKAYTIIELLITIVIIGILVAITAVSYNGITKQANETVLKTDLKQAQTFIETTKIKTGVYPTVDAIPKSGDVKYEISANDAGNFYCITATKANSTPYHVANGEGVTINPCQGHEWGAPAPAGVNIAPPLNRWSLTGGMSLSNDGVLTVPLYPTYASITSPLIRVDKAVSVDINYQTLGGPEKPVWSINYFAEDKTTSVNNTWGYTDNGYATNTPLSSEWQNKNTGFALGPNVYYFRLSISTNTTYKGGVQIRNIETTLIR